MSDYSLRHLENHVVLRNLDALDARDRTTTAQLVAHIGEVRARRLYADAGYSSMYDYCIGRLRFSEDMAGKRITAAEIARRFPFVFDAIADRRLHITTLCLLSKHLDRLRGDAARELIAAAEGKTNDQIRRMLAERFPLPDLVARIVEIHDKETSESAPERICAESIGALLDPAYTNEAATPTSPPVQATPTIHIEAAKSDRTTPLSRGRFGLQLTISAETHEKWCRLGELLAPGVPRGDFAQRLDRALDASLAKIDGRRPARPTPRAKRARARTTLTSRQP